MTPPTHLPGGRSRLAVFATLFATCLTAFHGIAAPPTVGEPFPPLESFALEGRLPDAAGRVVLIDFWAAGCEPCRKSVPVLKKLHETYSSRGLLVLGLSIDERRAAMHAFLKKVAPGFPVLRDAKGTLSAAVGLDGVPMSLLVGRDGKVRAIHHGLEGDAARQQLTQEIEAALIALTP